MHTVIKRTADGAAELISSSGESEEGDIFTLWIDGALVVVTNDYEAVNGFFNLIENSGGVTHVESGSSNSRHHHPE